MENDVYSAFMQAAKELSIEKNLPIEAMNEIMEKLIYLFVTRI